MPGTVRRSAGGSIIWPQGERPEANAGEHRLGNLLGIDLVGAGKDIAAEAAHSRRTLPALSVHWIHSCSGLIHEPRHYIGKGQGSLDEAADRWTWGGHQRGARRREAAATERSAPPRAQASRTWASLSWPPLITIAIVQGASEPRSRRSAT